MDNTATKIEMYKAVEEVCATHHLYWNTIEGFGSAFSRFATKVAKLDLLISEKLSAPSIAANAAHVSELCKALVREIDLLLQHTIDRLASVPAHPAFYHSYHMARKQEAH